MKNIIYIVFLISSIIAKAQEVVPKEQEAQHLTNGTFQDKYFKDTNGHLNKFIGSWKWQDSQTNPTKILEITFLKVQNEFTGSYYRDLLFSKYKYYENGVEIYNTEYIFDDRFIFGGLFSFPNNLNKLRLLYSEPDPATDGYRYSFHIEYLPNTTTGGIEQLKWDVEILLEVAENAEQPKIPRHIILTKQ